MALSETRTFVDFPLASYNELSASYLLVSQLSGDSLHSFKIKTSDLAKQIFQDYSHNSGLGSMAFEDERAYAKSYHDHDIYTSAYWHQKINGEDSHHLLKIVDETHNKTFNVSASCKHDDSTDEYRRYAKNRISSLQPKLGEVMFNANKRAVCINPDDSAFIGWLPANGEWYKINKFSLSDDFSKVFYVSNGQMMVPSIQNFIKFTISLNENVIDLDYRTCLPAHSHPVTSLTSPTVTINLDENGNWGIRSGPFQGTKTLIVDTYKDYTDHGNIVHNGKKPINAGDVDVTPVSCQIPLDSNIFNNANTTTDYTGVELDNEVYPAYVTLSAFVYVGRSYKSVKIVDF